MAKAGAERVLKVVMATLSKGAKLWMLRFERRDSEGSLNELSKYHARRRPRLHECSLKYEKKARRQLISTDSQIKSIMYNGKEYFYYEDDDR